MSALIQLNASNVISLVKNRWRYGQSVEGVGRIGVYSSKYYELKKYRLNPDAQGYVDLFLHGNLAAGLLLKKINNSLFQILSDDRKYKWMADRYGANEFGIKALQQDEFLMELGEIVIIDIYNELF